MKPYLKIHVEVLNLDGADDDGLVVSERRIYPYEVVSDPSSHTFITYEVLDILDKIRKALP